MTLYPTEEMRYYAAEVVKTRPTAVHSGINGDQSHFTANTYHIGIGELPNPGGYTNRDWFDQMPSAGSRYLASAVDTSKSTADMVADWKNFERLFYDLSDPRRDVMAEYIGWNGVGRAERLDFIRNTRTVADSTHTWHDHDARKRNLVNSREATLKQLSVRRGETKEQYLASIGQGSQPQVSTGEDDDMLLIYGAPTGEGSRWAVVQGGVWTEFVTQAQGDAASAGAGRSFGTTSGSVYAAMRAPYAAAGMVRTAPASV